MIFADYPHGRLSKYLMVQMAPLSLVVLRAKAFRTPIHVLAGSITKTTGYSRSSLVWLTSGSLISSYLKMSKGSLIQPRDLFLNAIIDRFNQLGYTLSYGILNALDFGVPQKRSRFFLIGSRSNRKVELPRGTVSTPTTVKDAIADLPKLVNGANKSWLSYGDVPPSTYARKLRKKLDGCSSHFVTKNSDEVIRRYRFVPPGGNWENIPSKMMKNYKDRHRCHTGIYHRLHYDRPSIVIGNYRKNMLIHPSENRGLSVREAARIQSFPDSYEFAGSIGFQQQQVGNAVPPQLAEAVFRQLHIG